MDVRRPPAVTLRKLHHRLSGIPAGNAQSGFNHEEIPNEPKLRNGL